MPLDGLMQSSYKVANEAGGEAPENFEKEGSLERRKSYLRGFSDS